MWNKYPVVTESDTARQFSLRKTKASTDKLAVFHPVIGRGYQLIGENVERNASLISDSIVGIIQHAVPRVKHEEEGTHSN